MKKKNLEKLSIIIKDMQSVNQTMTSKDGVIYVPKTIMNAWERELFKILSNESSDILTEEL